MSVYIFIGPTLSMGKAREILDATYLPPVAMGDVYRLMKKQPIAIGIIDGLFQSVPSVWHKEILFALASGVRVFGASSMGALRAAELHAFGMDGVGRIFEAYRDGELEDDDEVALVHATAEFGYKPLSEAMVNLRHGLEKAESARCIRASTRRALTSAAKQMFYQDRTWTNLLARGRDVALPGDELEALSELVERDKPNLKRDDAIELLELMASQLARGLEPHQPTFDFQHTFFWPKMVEDVEKHHSQL